MSRQYKVDREYNIVEIIQYNLKKWWLAVIMAVLCAAALGAYKYNATHDYVEKEIYENKQQIAAALFVGDYNETSVVERVANIIKISKSSRALEKVCDILNVSMTIDEYSGLFEMMHNDASGVVNLYVTFPVSVGDITIEDETNATKLANAIIEATLATTEEILGEGCVSVLDDPYAKKEVVKIENYSISVEDFRKGVMKAVVAGAVLGVIVEVVFYTFWMLIYRKPKNAEEVRESLDANIIDVLKDGQDNEDAFKKVALYLMDDQVTCNKVSCINLQSPKKDAALKLAMSYANEQKKTLYVDLSATEGTSENADSISAYILGEKEEVKPAQMNPYLDSVCRSHSEEKGLDIAGNKRFAEFIENMSSQYECIVINSQDAVKSADAYLASKLCNRTFVVCGRKSISNETLYRAKNTADVNEIQIDGVLVYEL